MRRIRSGLFRTGSVLVRLGTDLSPAVYSDRLIKVLPDSPNDDFGNTVWFNQAVSSKSWLIRSRAMS